jgi:hypothetical protein
MYVAKVNLGDVRTVVIWARDGTGPGTDLFAPGVCPMVNVVIQSTGSAGTWTMNGCWGPMFRSGIQAQRDGYAWVTEYDSTFAVWYTTIVPASTVTGGNRASVANRRAYVYAMGKGPT